MHAVCPCANVLTQCRCCVSSHEITHMCVCVSAHMRSRGDDNSQSPSDDSQVNKDTWLLWTDGRWRWWFAASLSFKLYASSLPSGHAQSNNKAHVFHIHGIFRMHNKTILLICCRCHIRPDHAIIGSTAKKFLHNTVIWSL